MISGSGIAQSFRLTPAQSQAAELRGQDLAVTAGAGSGKTQTLVARYLSLLAEGLSPRQIVAITFTEKAAREMRNRVRSRLSELARQAQARAERGLWEQRIAQMDAARIGTIHSLCAELLRLFPVEQRIDPLFEVLDEGQAAALRVRVVQDALAWAAAEPTMALLFDCLTVRGLETLLAYLLARRLDAEELLSVELDPGSLISQALHASLERPEITGAIDQIRSMQAAGELEEDAGPKLAAQLGELLEGWSVAEASLAAGDWLACAQLLFAARRTKMNLQAGKKTSQAKLALAALRLAYDQSLDSWLGGSKVADPGPNPEIEEGYLRAAPAIREIFRFMSARYQAELAQRRALDFDDLEAGAAALLQRDAVRAAWQAEVEAVLVDEFQDTNRRQRQIVTALAHKPGQPGRLFVVGDARQSIYRFRGADVRVFRGLQEEIAQSGGQVIDLDLTFRAHRGLLAVTEAFLAATMGVQVDPAKPYQIPFSPLTAFRQQTRPENQEPFLEFILGSGENADQGRRAAAQALAGRLLELKQAGQIENWQEVCLLFRASNSFPYYEQALENNAIPFVTVAGRGFYDRPEIRDLLNILRALADPWDDLALAGALRSPAFGLSDAALYRLRWSGDRPLSLWSALERGRELLGQPDQALAARAWMILSELHPQVDRLPVPELLKMLIDATDLRAILAAAESSGQDDRLRENTRRENTRRENSRLWRNLDKLLDDAAASRLVNVRAFLEYLTTLQDAGAREGEAPVEAENEQGGAVRLMTVHKAKGLEFNLVVIADAGRSPRGSAEPAYWMADTGLAARLDNLEGESLVYRLARWQDAQQSQAEEQRLLYVAMTRARERLIVNGHLADKNQRLRASGWLDELLGAAQVDVQALQAGAAQSCFTTPDGYSFGIQLAPADQSTGYKLPESQPVERPASALPALYQAIPIPPAPEVETSLPQEFVRSSWRSDAERQAHTAELVGRMVHRALQRWLFPGDAALDALLESLAVENGLTEARRKAETLQNVRLLLERIQAHPLWAEVAAAQARYHEVPYARQSPGRGVEAGFIDLLYQDHKGWHLIEFKTDGLSGAHDLEQAIENHRTQIQRYRQALHSLLGPLASARFCFLDVAGRVELVDGS